MQNRSDQLENGELPVAQPLLSGQQQTNKDHSRLRSASSPSRSPDHHGGRLSSGLSYVPRPRELDSRRDDYYRGESSTRDPHYYYSDELRDTSRGDHYGGRRESSRDDYYERRRESSRGGDRHDGRRESSRDDFYEKRRESSLDDYYGRGREPRRDDPYEERREPRLASTSSSLMPASVPFTSNAAVAAVAAAPMATTNTTITTAPQPASTRGMTGTNLIPLATRKAPKTIVDTGKVMPTKKTTTVSAAATTTATTTSVTAAATNETGEKRATQPNGAQQAGRKMQRLQSYLNGPPDPPADLVVWTGVSARMHRRNLVMDYSGAFALVWEKGDYENRAHSFKGPNKSNLYAEFLAAYEVLKSTPKTKTILIKTTSAELINAIQNKVDTTFTREVVTLRSELRWEVRNRPGVYFKKVPSRCGLPENDLACAMAEEARKDIEESRPQPLAQVDSTVTGNSTMQQAQAFLQQLTKETWGSTSNTQATQQQQQQKQQQQQQQALIAQNKAADSGQSLETVLRQRALASMQADNTVSPLSFMSYSSSLASAKTVRPFVAPQIASSSVNQQQDRVDEDGRLAKARKTSYSDTATAHQQVESHTRDPRLRKKAPASQQAHASTSAVVPPLSAPGAQPLQPPQAPQEQQQIRAHPQTRMAGRHLQMVQNIIRPTPETRNTVKNRGLSSERSNDQHAKPTPPSSSPANNTFTAPAQDGESDEEFFDALDYWVGQHYEDLKKDTKGGSENKADDDGEGKADPSSTLSWISDLL